MVGNRSVSRLTSPTGRRVLVEDKSGKHLKESQSEKGGSGLELGKCTKDNEARDFCNLSRGPLLGNIAVYW